MLFSSNGRRPDPHVTRVVAARFISHTGGVAGFFLGIWGKAAYELNTDAFGLALVMAVTGLGGLVGAMAAGVLVDRTNPKKVLIGGELVFVPAVLSLVLADSIQMMAVLVLPATLAGAVVFTAVTTLPPFLTDDPRRLERLNAYVEGAGTAAFIAGPVVGAFLVNLAGVSWVFVLDAVTSIIGVAILLPVRLRPIHRVEPDRTSLQDLRAGFRFTYGRRTLRLLLVLATATYLSFGVFGGLEPLFFRDVLGRGPEMIGYVNAVFGAGLLAGSLLYGRASERLTSLRVAAMVTVASGAGAVLYTGTDRLAVVVAGAVVWGTILGVLMPLVRTIGQLEAPEGMVGRVMGTLQVHHQAGDLMPLLFAPALAGVFGVQAVLVGSGVVVAVVALVTLPAARRMPPAPDQVEPVYPPGAVEEPIGAPTP